MLSRGDDYPIHQKPVPLADAGGERNFYDRYYFNGFSEDGGSYFAVALGVYPYLGVMDAHACVQREGVQRCVFASRALGGKRMDTRVGPIAIDIVEPLARLDVRIDAPELGLAGRLTFTGRTAPQEEPRFVWHDGPRTVLDLTRMTQLGRWQGALSVDGTDIVVDGWRATRDRSWGVRPIGARDAQPMLPAGQMQWFWLWGPTHFDDLVVHFHTNDDAHGNGWNRQCVLVPTDGGAPRHLSQPRVHIEYREGCRQLARASISGMLADGRRATLALECGEVIYMQGAGYNHPEWGHGSYHGEFAVHGETRDCRTLDPNDFAQIHLQSLTRATLAIAGEATRTGRGILEQMLLGPHAPSETI
ncbi:hypothetical protein [Craterilacuibacter sp.]|uniref:hypothetical protein n=1 Tax=Craterilacuibacter sp. TaxID=2870909 RepID=UPI003F2D1ECA